MNEGMSGANERINGMEEGRHGMCARAVSSSLQFFSPRSPVPDGPCGADGTHGPHTFVTPVPKGDCHSIVDDYALNGLFGGLVAYL